MQLNLRPVGVPLREHAPGAYRVGNSRVSLDIVIGEFKGGADPESIARAYGPLRLGDVYAVIAYYLANQDEVEAYLRASEAEEEALRRQVGSEQPTLEEMKARWASREVPQHASAGQ